MKKLVAVLFAVLCLVGCARSVHPESITEVDFPLEEAIPMIEQLEEPFLLLSDTDTISGEQLLEYKKTSILFDETHQASMIRSIIVTDPEIEEFVIDSAAVYQRQENMTYPTVFHEDFDVTSAVIRKTHYKEEYSGFEKEQLIITETYSGEEPMLKDFERNYIFERDDIGEWKLDVCSGVIEYSFAEEIELPLKRSDLSDTEK